jgi:hypothetical protein
LYLLKYDLKIKKNKETKKQNNKVSKKSKIYLVYFSCKKHFKYLFTSLKSLEKINSKYIGNVYLYIDKRDYLSEDNISQLKTLSLTIILRKTKHRMSWGGPNLILNELTAFKEVSQQINQNDYIAKVDSDILFISDNIFKKVTKSKFSLVGDEFIHPYISYKYIIGGCYFLKNSLIPQITNYPLFEVILEVLKKTGGYINFAEDAAVFNLIKRNTSNVKFENFYLPSSRINNLNKITKKDKERYSVIHFWFDKKDKMLEVSRKIFRP